MEITSSHRRVIIAQDVATQEPFTLSYGDFHLLFSGKITAKVITIRAQSIVLASSACLNAERIYLLTTSRMIQIFGCLHASDQIFCSQAPHMTFHMTDDLSMRNAVFALVQPLYFKELGDLLTV